MDGQAGHDQQEDDAGADDGEGGLGEAPAPEVALDAAGEDGEVVFERLPSHRPQCPPLVRSAPAPMMAQTVRLRIR